MTRTELTKWLRKLVLKIGKCKTFGTGDARNIKFGRTYADKSWQVYLMDDRILQMKRGRGPGTDFYFYFRTFHKFGPDEARHSKFGTQNDHSNSQQVYDKLFPTGARSGFRNTLFKFWDSFIYGHGTAKNIKIDRDFQSYDHKCTATCLWFTV